MPSLAREIVAVTLGGNPKPDALAAAKSLVADIRRNRKNGTEPWKGGSDHV